MGWPYDNSQQSWAEANQLLQGQQEKQNALAGTGSYGDPNRPEWFGPKQTYDAGISPRILATEYGMYGQAAASKAQAQLMQEREARQADWGQAQADYEMGLESRGEQSALGDIYKTAIAGEGPSVAEKQMYAGRDMAIRAAQSAAANARGGALARNVANRGAVDAATLATQQTAQQAAMLRAQEQMQARDAYAQMLAGMRGQDIQSRGLSQGQAQFDVEAEYKQRALNDAMTQAYWQNALAAQQGLLSGQVQQQSNWLTNKQLEQAKEAQQNAITQQYVGAALGAGATIGAGALTGGAGGAVIGGMAAGGGKRWP